MLASRDQEMNLMANVKLTDAHKSGRRERVNDESSSIQRPGFATTLNGTSFITRDFERRHQSLYSRPGTRRCGWMTLFCSTELEMPGPGSPVGPRITW